MHKIGYLFYNHKHMSLGDFIEQCIMIVKKLNKPISHIEISTQEAGKIDNQKYDVVKVINVLKNHVYVVLNMEE